MLQRKNGEAQNIFDKLKKAPEVNRDNEQAINEG